MEKTFADVWGYDSSVIAVADPDAGKQIHFKNSMACRIEEVWGCLRVDKDLKTDKKQNRFANAMIADSTKKSCMPDASNLLLLFLIQ